MAPKGKKRYQVTLTQATVETFQKISEEMNIPQGTMSIILDEALEKVTDTMLKLKAKGTCTFGDLFQLIGEELDQIQKEEINDAKKIQEAETKKSVSVKAKSKSKSA